MCQRLDPRLFETHEFLDGKLVPRGEPADLCQNGHELHLCASSGEYNCNRGCIEYPEVPENIDDGI